MRRKDIVNSREYKIGRAAVEYANSIAQPEERKKYSVEDFEAGVEWADANPKSKYNISDVDLVVSQLGTIVSNAERMTTGNFAHNRASILLLARNALNHCKRMEE